MIDYQLENKLCLVTGGSRGVGLAIVHTLLDQGAKVVCVAKHASVIKYGERYYPYDCDLLQPGYLDKFLQQCLSEHGLPNIVVHNLGGSCQVTSDFASIEDWMYVWQFNFGIAVEINNLLLPKFIKQELPAKLIHISTSAVKTLNGYMPYIAAKSALNAYVKATALRYSKHNILINAVAPGAVKLPGRYFSLLQEKEPLTLKGFLDEHVALNRLAEPEEIAAVILFLASSLSSYITGSIIDVDGGIH